MQSEPRPKSEIWSLFLTVETQKIPEYVFALEPLNATISWAEKEGELKKQLDIIIAPDNGFKTSQDAKETVEKYLKAFDLPSQIESIKKLPHKNWLEENRKQFPPIECGPFFIYCSYYEGDLPQDKITLKLNAALAFGSGEHETTRGCLRALERLQNTLSPKHILDLGCGSGILAIAASKIWPTASLLATDFDHFAVKTTQTNAKENNTPHVTSLFSDGFEAIESKDFDLIIANILADPLISFAPSVAEHLKPSGYLILSGLLERQASDVQAAYEKQGLILKDAFHINTWSTLILQKEG